MTFDATMTEGTTTRGENAYRVAVAAALSQASICSSAKKGRRYRDRKKKSRKTLYRPSTQRK